MLDGMDWLDASLGVYINLFLVNYLYILFISFLYLISISSVSVYGIIVAG